jgi:hypothetical protein
MQNYVVLFGSLLTLNFIFVFYLLYQYKNQKKLNLELVKYIVTISAAIQQNAEDIDEIKTKKETKPENQ